MRRSFMISAALCGPSIVFSMQAQVPTGSLSGIARDSSGRVVTGASVRATSKAQGLVRTGMTNSDGSFLLDNLAPATTSSFSIRPVLPTCSMSMCR